MSWRYPRLSPLAHLHLDARAATAEASVWLCERAPASLAILRGDARDSAFASAAGQALGLALPPVGACAQQGDYRALGLGPDEWLVRGPEGADPVSRLHQALAGVMHQAVEISDARAIIGLGGGRANDVLLKGCSLDLHSSAFQANCCAQTLLGRVGVLLHALPADEPHFDLYVARSLADYLWRWLEDAAAEFGYAIRADG